jgi:hypothetical protein
MTALTYEQKCQLARQAEPGDVWKNPKTGRTVTILGAGHRFRSLRLQHELGRITEKQDHYFAYDYDPVTKAPAEAS